MSNNLYNNDYTTLNNLHSIAVSNIELYGNINQDVGDKSNFNGGISTSELIVNNSATVYEDLYLGKVEENENGLFEVTGNIGIKRLNGGFNIIPFTQLDKIRTLTGDAQSQINDRAKLISNNVFTGSLNTFDAILFNSVKFSNSINNTPANYYDGLVSNIQTQINTLKAGSPVNGQSATIAIRTTTTLQAGLNASVTNSGNNLDAIFNFGIPRGIQGETPTLEIGTVTTGSTANVTINNSNLTNPKLNFTLVNGTNGITPTFSINSVVDNLPSGYTPTITLTDDPTIVNNKIFKFGLVRGVNGTDGIDGITPTFSIDSVSSVPYGETASVSINNSIPTNPKLSFVLNTGDKGDKGDQGDPGPPGTTQSSGDILAIIATALGGISILTLYTYVTILQEEVIVIQGQIITIDTSIKDLYARTAGLSHSVGTGRSNFNNTLTISSIVPFSNAVELNSTIPSNFYFGIVTTGLTAGAIGCTSIINTGDTSIAGVLDVTGETNLTGEVTIEGDANFAGTVTIEGETNFVGIVTMQGDALFEAETNFAGAVNIEGIVTIVGDTNIEGILTNTGDLEIIGGNINQTQINDEETGLPIPLSNRLFDTSITGNINQINLLPNNPLHTAPTTTLLDTDVKSLTIASGDITQSLGTSYLYNLDVTNDVNLNGFQINIGDTPENHIINIGSSDSLLTLEGDVITIGVASVANTINIGNNFTTLTLRSIANQPINIDSAMNQFQEQFDADIEQILNEINSF